MKATDIISVNPSKNALGHGEVSSSSIFRSSVVNTPVGGHSINILNLVFPTQGHGFAEFRKYEVPMRTLFATLLIVAGISMLEASVATGMAICSLCFGGFLALGLLTRPVMLGAGAFYCITGALSLRAGQVNMMAFSLMFGSLIFAIMGSGKYSCDSLIRNSIVRYKRRLEKRRKEGSIGYKAFHNVRF